MLVEVTTAANTTVSGSYIAAWTSEVGRVFFDGSSSIQLATATVPNVVRPIHKGATITIPNKISQKWLYIETKGEVEDSDHGTFILVLNGAIGNLTTTSGVTLNVVLKWEIEVNGIVLPPEPGSKVDIYADDGYENYFTDSSSDWAGGKKLTLKHKEGGSVVPFSSAQPETVYKINASVAEYYTSSSTKATFKYGVRIRNFAYPALCVFADLAKALEYAKSGDEANCLDWVAAGPWILPSSPSWSSNSLVSAPLYSNLAKPQKLEESFTFLGL